MRLIERYHTSFVRSGANLNDADKATLYADLLSAADALTRDEPDADRRSA